MEKTGFPGNPPLRLDGAAFRRDSTIGVEAGGGGCTRYKIRRPPASVFIAVQGAPACHAEVHGTKAGARPSLQPPTSHLSPLTNKGNGGRPRTPGRQPLTFNL